MSRPYEVVTDAAADIMPELLERLKIRVIPMDVSMGDTSFQHYADYRNMSADDFYPKVRGGIMPSTSQVTPVEYSDFFKPILEEGKDILYIAFSSGMSGMYNSCMITAEDLREKYPDRKICVVDSLGATGGEGLFTCYVAENRDKGMSIEDNAKWSEDNKLKMAHYWTVNDLMHLKRGGRVKAVDAYFGTALNIKPVGHIDNDGHLPAIAKVHGRKPSLKKMVDYMKETIVSPQGQRVQINHCDCPGDAELLKSMVLESNLGIGEVMIGDLGPVVGAHLGPGGITLFFWAGRR